MADENTFEFELVSPERLVVSEPAQMVVLPGGDGDFGVLPGHAPLLSTMRPGTICVFENNKVRARIFVGGGFIEVTPQSCTVLAEVAVSLDELDRAAIEQNIRDLRDDVADKQDDAQRAEAERGLDVARAMLAALDRPAYQ